jgi:hypothetical protein
MLPLEVIGEEVARDPELVIRNGKTLSQEADEEADHFRIRVRKDHGIPLSRTLGPVQHAPCKVEGIALVGLLASPPLCIAARCAGGVPRAPRRDAEQRDCASKLLTVSSSMSRTQRLTEDRDTPTTRAISFIERPSSWRRRRASRRSAVFITDNVAEPSDDAKAAYRSRTDD